MKDNSKLWIGLFIGVAAGTTLALLAGSDKGQEVIAEIKDAGLKAEKEIKKALEKFEETVAKSKELAGNFEKKAGKFVKQHTS